MGIDAQSALSLFRTLGSLGGSITQPGDFGYEMNQNAVQPTADMMAQYLAYKDQKKAQDKKSSSGLGGILGGIGGAALGTALLPGFGTVAGAMGGAAGSAGGEAAEAGIRGYDVTPKALLSSGVRGGVGGAAHGASVPPPSVVASQGSSSGFQPSLVPGQQQGQGAGKPGGGQTMTIQEDTEGGGKNTITMKRVPGVIPGAPQQAPQAPPPLVEQQPSPVADRVRAGLEGLGQDTSLAGPLGQVGGQIGERFPKWLGPEGGQAVGQLAGTLLDKKLNAPPVSLADFGYEPVNPLGMKPEQAMAINSQRMQQAQANAGIYNQGQQVDLSKAGQAGVAQRHTEDLALRERQLEQPSIREISWTGPDGRTMTGLGQISADGSIQRLGEGVPKKDTIYPTGRGLYSQDKGAIIKGTEPAIKTSMRAAGKHGDWILTTDPATGETKRTFSPRPGGAGAGAESPWDHIGIEEFDVDGQTVQAEIEKHEITGEVRYKEISGGPKGASRPTETPLSPAQSLFLDAQAEKNATIALIKAEVISTNGIPLESRGVVLKLETALRNYLTSSALDKEETTYPVSVITTEDGDWAAVATREDGLMTELAIVPKDEE